MKRIYRIFAVMLVITLVFSCFAISWADEPFTLMGTHVYKVKNVYRITNAGEGTAFDINVTVPIGADSTSKYEKMLSYTVTPTVNSIRKDSDGNILGSLVIGQLKAGESSTVTVEKTVQNSGITYSSSIDSISGDYNDFLTTAANAQYFQPAKSIESDASEITQKAADFGRDGAVVVRTRNIYDFVNLFMNYNDSPEYSNKGALSAMRTSQGVCYEYATLFTALCRASGIPARVVTGYWDNDYMPENQWVDVSNAGHAWAEFFVPSVGWVPVEPTFILLVDNQKTPDHDYFAALPENSRHFISGYGTSYQDVSVRYWYYTPTNLDIASEAQQIMLADSTAPVEGFLDSSGSWAGQYIEKLYLSGIVFAKEDSLFKPEDKITRAEFAAFLVNALKLNLENSIPAFKDVKEDSPYAKHIAAASKAGLIMGYQGYFKPDDTIYRQDAAAIMERALNMLGKNNYTVVPISFDDNAQISNYAVSAVTRIYSQQIMTGRPGNIFAPKSDMTRAEAAKTIDNFLNILQ